MRLKKYLKNLERQENLIFVKEVRKKQKKARNVILKRFLQKLCLLETTRETKGCAQKL